MLRALFLLALVAAPAFVALRGPSVAASDARSGAVPPPARRASAAEEPLALAAPARAPAGASRALGERAPGERGLALRVVAAEGERPLAGATVRWRARGALDGALRRDPCDELGRWRSDADPLGPVVVEAPGHVPRDVRALLAAGRELEVRLWRAAQRDVLLCVTSATGEPVPAAELVLAAPQAGRVLGTDAAGKARIRLAGGVPSLRLAGRAEAPGFLPRRFSALDLGTGELRVWNEGLPEVRATIVLDRPACVSGIVVDPSGAPLPGVEIAVRARRRSGSGCDGGAPEEPSLAGRTDAHGRYALDGLPVGRVLEWTFSSGRELVRHVATLAGPAQSLDWTFAPQGSPAACAGS